MFHPIVCWKELRKTFQGENNFYNLRGRGVNHQDMKMSCLFYNFFKPSLPHKLFPVLIIFSKEQRVVFLSSIFISTTLSSSTEPQRSESPGPRYDNKMQTSRNWADPHYIASMGSVYRKGREQNGTSFLSLWTKTKVARFCPGNMEEPPDAI